MSIEGQSSSGSVGKSMLASIMVDGSLYMKSCAGPGNEATAVSIDHSNAKAPVAQLVRACWQA